MSSIGLFEYEDSGLMDSDEETHSIQRSNARTFLSSNLDVSKFMLLVNFMYVRNLGTESSLSAK
eukprot:11664980-Karenia_brevis.AAC.1